MILRTKKEQEAFLKECYENISRIYNTYLTESEYKGYNDSNDLKWHKKGSLEQGLPQSIEPYGIFDDIKEGKFFVLCIIYNKVAQAFPQNQPLDLNQIFVEAKNESNHRLSSRLGMYADELMLTPRKQCKTKGIVGDLIRFFTPRPTSEEFLRKYGFFAAVSNPMNPLFDAWNAIKRS